MRSKQTESFASDLLGKKRRGGLHDVQQVKRDCLRREAAMEAARPALTSGYLVHVALNDFLIHTEGLLWEGQKYEF